MKQKIRTDQKALVSRNFYYVKPVDIRRNGISPTEEEINAFIKKNGITECPGVGDPKLVEAGSMIFDPKIRKYTRRDIKTKISWGYR
jgi:hypothetical protein